MEMQHRSNRNRLGQSQCEAQLLTVRPIRQGLDSNAILFGLDDRGLSIGKKRSVKRSSDSIRSVPSNCRVIQRDRVDSRRGAINIDGQNPAYLDVNFVHADGVQKAIYVGVR